MTLSRVCLVVLSFLVALPISAATPVKIEVFHTHQSRLVNVPKDVVLYNVDIFIELQANLKQTFADSIDEYMDDDEKQALAHALTKKLGFKRRSINKAMTMSWLGLYKLNRYDLAYLPAIVFNETAVIYGEENIGKALSLYTTRVGSP